MLRDHLPDLILDQRLTGLIHCNHVRYCPEELQAVSLETVNVVLQSTASRFKAPQLLPQLIPSHITLSQTVPGHQQFLLHLPDATLQLLVDALQAVQLTLHPLPLRHRGASQVQQLRLAVRDGLTGAGDLVAHLLQFCDHVASLCEHSVRTEVRRFTDVHPEAQSESTSEIVELTP